MGSEIREESGKEVFNRLLTLVRLLLLPILRTVLLFFTSFTEEVGGPVDQVE